MKKHLTIGIALAALLTACGSTEPGAPAHLSVFARATTLTEGDTMTVRVNVLDSDDKPVANPELTFKSSVPSVASVDGNGLVRALKAGSVAITASSGGFSNSVGLNVGVKITP